MGRRLGDESAYHHRFIVVRAAKELGYGKKVIEALKAAETVEEMDHILATERRRM